MCSNVPLVLRRCPSHLPLLLTMPYIVWAFRVAVAVVAIVTVISGRKVSPAKLDLVIFALLSSSNAKCEYCHSRHLVPHRVEVPPPRRVPTRMLHPPTVVPSRSHLLSRAKTGIEKSKAARIKSQVMATERP